MFCSAWKLTQYCTVLYCTVLHCATLCARKLRKEERRKQIFRCGLSWSTLTTLSLESTSTTLHTTLHRTIIGLQAQLPTILIFIFNPLHPPLQHQPSIAVSNIYILPDTLLYCHLYILPTLTLAYWPLYIVPTLTLPYCHIATHLGFISTSHPLRDQ